jgi:NADPH:quinone reductase-like Zn-dependent oxidoreductase
MSVQLSAREATMSVQLSVPRTMKAVVFHRYGPPEQLELKEIDTPAVDDDGVLVRVRAAGLNALDWRVMRGSPYVGRLIGMGFRRPNTSIPGVDLAGDVVAVGKNVTEFKPGNEVIGHRGSSCAEYVLGKERHFVPKPARLTFEQAAAVPVACLTALQGLRDVGRLQPGQRVLINGASGGVGTFTVQVGKALGADVTAVCSTRSVDMVRSIGADHVIDRTKEDFTRSGQRYDVIFDVAGDRSLRDCRRVLGRDGTLAIAGGSYGRWFGPVTRMLQAVVLRRFVSQRLVPFMAKGGKDDLLVLKELIEAGKLTPVVDRTYPLSETAQAIRYLEERRAQGKVIITM